MTEMHQSTPIAPPKSERAGLVACATLLLVPWLSALAFSGLTPVLPQIDAHFRHVPGAEALVRALITAVGGAVVVGAWAGGFLAERVGERGVLLVSLLAFALAGSLGFVLDDPWHLLASRIVLGVAVAAAGVMAITLLTLLVPDASRNRWLGLFAVSGSIGAVVLLPIAGRLGSLDWRYVFLLHLIAVPLLLIVALKVPRAEPGRHPRDLPRDATGFPWSLLLLGLGCGAVLNTIPVYLPFHLSRVGDVGARELAAAMMVLTGVGGLFAVSYGWIRRFLGTFDVFAGGFLLVAAGLLTVAFSPGYLPALLGLVLAGAAVGVLTPNLFAIAADTIPERRARRMGLARAGFFGAPMIAQLLLEPVAGRHGPGGALTAVALLALAMTAISIGRRKTVSCATD